MRLFFSFGLVYWIINTLTSVHFVFFVLYMSLLFEKTVVSIFFASVFFLSTVPGLYLGKKSTILLKGFRIAERSHVSLMEPNGISESQSFRVFNVGF